MKRIKQDTSQTGFTLLELMAVIVVLGMIALITVPIITKTIRDARRNNFKTSMYHLLEAAKNYYADQQIDINETTLFDFLRGGANDKGDTLSFQGTKPTSGQVTITSKGEVTFEDVSNGKYYANYHEGDDDIKITENSETWSRDELSEFLKGLEDEMKKTKVQVDSNTALSEKATETASVLSKKFLDKTYPIGSIYISDNSTNPSELFGGTWENYGSGKALKGIDSGTAGVTGGNNTVTLTVENMPKHQHTIPALSGTANSAGAHTHASITSGVAASNGAHTHTISGSTSQASITGYAEFRSATSDRNFVMGVSGILSKSDISWAGSHALLDPVSESNSAYNVLTIDLTHSHTVTGTAASAGAHTHTVSGTANSAGAHTHDVTTNANTTGATGKGTAFSVENEYITVYMWRRTA